MSSVIDAFIIVVGVFLLVVSIPIGIICLIVWMLTLCLFALCCIPVLALLWLADLTEKGWERCRRWYGR